MAVQVRDRSAEAAQWAAKKQAAIRKAHRLREAREHGVDFLTLLAAAEERDAPSPLPHAAPPPPRRRPAPRASSARAHRRAAPLAPPPAATPPASRRTAAARDPLRELAALGYACVGPIAAGAFSVVLRAVVVGAVDGEGRQLPRGVEVAVKTYEAARCVGALAEGRDREVEVLRRLKPSSHPHIANLVAEHTGPIGVQLALQYCGGGSLHRLISRQAERGLPGLPVVEARLLAAQLSSALSHLHTLGIAHRDLKPSNVLLAHKRHWRLCDFGFAVHCAERKLKKAVGTPLYMAPEVISHLAAPEGGFLGAPVDMWAFGGLLFEAMHGRPAFVAPSMEQLHLRIRAGFTAVVGEWVPAGAKSLLIALLQREPLKRLRAKDAMAHTWLSDVKVETCNAKSAPASDRRPASSKLGTYISTSR